AVRAAHRRPLDVTAAGVGRPYEHHLALEAALRYPAGDHVGVRNAREIGRLRLEQGPELAGLVDGDLLVEDGDLAVLDLEAARGLLPGLRIESADQDRRVLLALRVRDEQRQPPYDAVAVRRTVDVADIERRVS